MEAKEFDVEFHIDKRRKEKDQLLWLWSRVQELNTEIGLSEDTYEELQAKISSRIAACDRSIQDHEKLLN